MCIFKKSALLIGFVLATSHSVLAQQVTVDPSLFTEGTALYLEHCSVCHGIEGDGKGPLATGFSPRPRDLTKSSFKFRSTGVGEFPTQSDLLDTLNRGVSGSYGSSMPSFDFLNERELLALVEVVRYVSGIDQFGVAVAPPPRPVNVDMDHAQELYRELSCAGCHGYDGNGQGDLAVGLLDDDGLPIKPANFRTGHFKGGADPENIWMRIYTGMSGTPMPAFGRNTSAADIWAVTEYVIKLSNEE
ncbi:c-type cytochrome [Litoreibacter roseus]|uniref:Cytochrome c domain-containing protein n=1 Tax=Litoreibacter roseus TaxID=2601869 RepID=A0A6N6JFI9_9RHOB|nr:c-type cytochrome [Litoreibacter roseus]GFE65111.1 hypothetical protein KIN_21850 [Litoreibacter roseus]